MATAAQRDRQIAAAEKRVESAQAKVTKAENDLAEQRKVLQTQTERIAWLRNMPVDDAPEGDADTEQPDEGTADPADQPEDDTAAL